MIFHFLKLSNYIIYSHPVRWRDKLPRPPLPLLSLLQLLLPGAQKELLLLIHMQLLRVCHVPILRRGPDLTDFRELNVRRLNVAVTRARAAGVC